MNPPNDPPDNDRTAKANIVILVANATENDVEHKAEAVVLGTIKEDPNT